MLKRSGCKLKDKHGHNLETNLQPKQVKHYYQGVEVWDFDEEAEPCPYAEEEAPDMQNILGNVCKVVG